MVTKPQPQAGEKKGLRYAYDLGRVRAMKDFLDDVKKNGGDIALAKAAHNILMYDSHNNAARWIMEQYGAHNPQEQSNTIEIVDPDTGEIKIVVTPSGEKVLEHTAFPEPILDSGRPCSHPCA